MRRLQKIPLGVLIIHSEIVLMTMRQGEEKEEIGR